MTSKSASFPAAQGKILALACTWTPGSKSFFKKKYKQQNNPQNPCNNNFSGDRHEQNLSNPNSCSGAAPPKSYSETAALEQLSCKPSGSGDLTSPLFRS